MGPLPARNVAGALARKGFVVRESHHTYFHFRYKGRDVGVSTHISQGEKEIGIGLIKRMRVQMKLANNADFARFVECTLSQSDYEAILRDQGLLSDADRESE